MEVRPNCEKCGNSGLVMVHSILLCGKCTIEWNNKMIEKHRKEVLE